ncbi:MAG TPA: OstA-like protein [Lentimicrobium sp.]|nr:OstA-like protein [Lentimicrobium sp.]
MIIKKILILFLILLFYIPGFSQTRKIKLVQADEAVYDRTLGEDVQRLIGNAIFEHEGALMYCDSAHLDNATNSMKAYGRVHIKSSDTLHLYGDSIYYSGETKIAEVFSNVKLIDNQTVLTTDKLIYDRNTGIASYTTGGHIVNEDNTLDSQRGYYHTNSKDFFFRLNVVLTNPDYVMNCDTLKYNTQTKISNFKGPTTIKGKDTDIYAENGFYNTDTDIAEFNENARVRNGDQTLTGDSLYYERTRGYGQAFRNIQVIDTVQDVIVYGHYALYDKSLGYTMITDSTEAHIIEDNDTLFMHSDTIKATLDSAEKTKELFAYYKMKFYRSDLQGMADSLVYIFADSTLKLYKSPAIWADENQLTADSIKILTGEDEIKKMFLYNTAFLVSKDTIGTGYNQIKGRDMTGTFVKNDLASIAVNGNAETIYWVREDDGTLIGINKSLASDMLIKLRDRKIKRITYLEKINGTLDPEDKVNVSELLLKNFQWVGDRRPLSKHDIFKW